MSAIKHIEMRTKQDNVHFINPQLFGNCPVVYILTVHLDNYKIPSHMPRDRDVFINNLVNTYGKNIVYTVLEQRGEL